MVDRSRMKTRRMASSEARTLRSWEFTLEVELGPASTFQTLCLGSVLKVWKQLQDDVSARFQSRAQCIFQSDLMVPWNPTPLVTGMLCVVIWMQLSRSKSSANDFGNKADNLCIGATAQRNALKHMDPPGSTEIKYVSNKYQNSWMGRKQDISFATCKYVKTCILVDQFGYLPKTNGGSDSKAPKNSHCSWAVPANYIF